MIIGMNDGNKVTRDPKWLDSVVGTPATLSMIAARLGFKNPCKLGRLCLTKKNMARLVFEGDAVVGWVSASGGTVYKLF